MIGNKTSAYLT